MFARTRFVFLACALLAALALPVLAADFDPDAAMAVMSASAEPGPVHALLASRAGEWSLSATSWMGPGAEPVQSASTSVGEMILGGRFLTERVAGFTMGTVTTVMTGIYEKPGQPMELVYARK